MILQIVILALAALQPLLAYSEHNGVLILTDDDLNNITDIFPHLFVKYYVPWYTCDHTGADIASSSLPFSRKLLRIYRLRTPQVYLQRFSSLGQD